MDSKHGKPHGSDLDVLKHELMAVATNFEKRTKSRLPPEIIISEMIGTLLSLAAFLAVNNTCISYTAFMTAAEKCYRGWSELDEGPTLQ